MRWTLALAGLVLSISTLSACGDDKPVPLEQRPGYSEAHSQAEIYCTLAGVVPDLQSLDDPAYLRCVDRETRKSLDD